MRPSVGSVGGVRGAGGVAGDGGCGVRIEMAGGTVPTGDFARRAASFARVEGVRGGSASVVAAFLPGSVNVGLRFMRTFYARSLAVPLRYSGSSTPAPSARKASRYPLAATNGAIGSTATVTLLRDSAASACSTHVSCNTLFGSTLPIIFMSGD